MKRLVLILLALPTFALAQETTTTTDEVDEASGRKIIYQKATQVDFEGVDVDAALTRPSISLVDDARRSVFKSFITLRTDFNSEMDASVGEVR